MPRLRITLVGRDEAILVHTGELHGKALVETIAACVRLMIEQNYSLRVDRLPEGP